MTAPRTLTEEDGTTRQQRLLRRLTRLRVLMICALAAQLLLGMANNLWLSQVPPTLESASPQALLSAHEDVAYLVTALAVWILVDAVRAHLRSWIVTAAAGIGGLVLALASGLTYWATEDDIWSMTMTVGFAVAVTSYALAGRQPS